MRTPPKLVRRLVIAPVVVAGTLFAVIGLPVALIGASFASRYVPGKWRILRIIWFLFLYLLVEASVLAMAFSLWIISGFGLRLRHPHFVAAHYWLLAWALRRVVASAKFTFRLSVIREEGGRPGPGPRKPIMVLSRHAGPGDSFLLMDGVANGVHRNPRIVLKSFLQWDPAVDVLLNRLPSAFVPPGSEGRDRLIGTITSMASTMGPDDAFVIFPEGANYTPNRARRALEKLREIGRPDLVERAAVLENTLPPRSRGVITALAAAPEGTDVYFVGHAGLETFVSPGDIWRGMPSHTNVAVRVWYFPADRIPPPERQEDWLFDMWVEIDGWISERLALTEEPFDDPDAY